MSDLDRMLESRTDDELAVLQSFLADPEQEQDITEIAVESDLLLSRARNAANNLVVDGLLEAVDAPGGRTAYRLPNAPASPKRKKLNLIFVLVAVIAAAVLLILGADWRVALVPLVIFGGLFAGELLSGKKNKSPWSN